jgi:hypothetical protein
MLKHLRVYCKAYVIYKIKYSLKKSVYYAAQYITCHLVTLWNVLLGTPA